MKKFFAFLFTLFCSALQVFPKGIMWIPSGDWQKDLKSLLDANPAMTLTIAPPLPISKEGKSILEKYAGENRVELALRLANDPFPSVLYFSRHSKSVPPEIKSFISDSPFFLAQRISDSKIAFPFQVSGFANTPGSIYGNYVPLLKSLGFSWTAAGPPVSTGTYGIFKCDGVAIIPFADGISTSSFSAGFIVFDETIHSSETVRKNLHRLAKGGEKLNSVEKEYGLAKNFREIRKDEIEKIFRPWLGDYSDWLTAPSQIGYLNALLKTRESILQKAGDPSVSSRLPEILAEYYEMEGRLNLKDLSPSAKNKKADISLRNKFAMIFMMLKTPPPSWVYKPFDKFIPANSEKRNIIVNAGERGIEFEKLSVSTSSPRITYLSVEWDDEVFRAELGYSLPRTTAAAESPVTAEIYMDINHRARAGMGKTLPPNPVSVNPADSWEFAVKMNSEKAVLYYATIINSRILYSTASSAGEEVLSASFPKSKLRGHPANWGFAAILKNSEGEILDILSGGNKNYINALRAVNDGEKR